MCTCRRIQFSQHICKRCVPLTIADLESLESCCVEVVLVSSACLSIVHQMQFPALSLSCSSYVLRFTFLLLGRLPKEQVTPEPEPQPKKKRPQLNDTHPSNCSTGRAFVCLLLVIGLCLVGGGVFWIYSPSAPGLSALNQGEGKVAVLCEMFSDRLC